MADVQMDIYEDMFKEITKKIYGQDCASSSEDREFTGQDAYKMVEEGLSMMDSAAADDAAQAAAAVESFGCEEQTPRPDADVDDDDDHDNDNGDDDGDDPSWVTSDETIPWTTSKIVSYNAEKKLFKCQECNSVGMLSSVAEHWLGTHADVKVFQCPQCPYASAWARCIRIHLARQHNVVADQGTGRGPQRGPADAAPWKESPVLEEVTGYLSRLKAAADKAAAAVTTANVASATGEEPADEFAAAVAAVSSAAGDDHRPQQQQQRLQSVAADTETQTAQKRFNCAHCPYATDRRDLFTRHENIHKAVKPFQCDICQKQFNRADHVKKHYTRMHREHEYSLSRVKRYRSYLQKHQKEELQQRLTLYSGDPPPPEPRVIAVQSSSQADARPLQQQSAAAPLVLHDQQQQQQTVVNIAVVNFNEQTGTHTIQIPIPAGQLKPVMFGPDTILSMDSIMSSGIASVASAVSVASVTGTTSVARTVSVAGTTSVAGMASVATVKTTAKPCKGKGSRKNPDRLYYCTYCSWSGVDNWCLKRHLNTHMKPYECVFCQYKAARAERLATHVFKVHGKWACCRCSYVAEDQDDLYAHQFENYHKSVRSRRTQTSPTPSSPEQVEETADKNDDVIVVWPVTAAAADTQNSV